jgi:hypothetical protein
VLPPTRVGITEASTTRRPESPWTRQSPSTTRYDAHYHHERPHQGVGNVVLIPLPGHRTARQGPIRCRERLGGLVKYYDGDAA